MPDPLMGFALQSFPPLVQPFAVSSAVALLSLKRASDLPESPLAVANAEALRRAIGNPCGRAVGTSLAFRALLHTRIRHFEMAV
jgi:hypothetical protein